MGYQFGQRERRGGPNNEPTGGAAGALAGGGTPLAGGAPLTPYLSVSFRSVWYENNRR